MAVNLVPRAEVVDDRRPAPTLRAGTLVLADGEWAVTDDPVATPAGRFVVDGDGQVAADDSSTESGALVWLMRTTPVVKVS